VIALLTNREQSGHQLAGHPERPARVTAILDAIARSDLGLAVETAPAVAPGLISMVHDPVYVQMLDEVARGGGGSLDPDTYMTATSMTAARTAAGAVVEGVDRVLIGGASTAFALVRPPGHHAERARAMGFCLLNNIGIGVAAARARGVRRIAIVDFDVHHGNGTQHSFQDDPEILYASTHQFPFYPGTGDASERGAHGTVLNIPLAAGSGDREFLGAYERLVGPALDRFMPELILVSAGFDAHRDDPLAGLAVTTEGYRELATLIAGWARTHCQGRTVWALEGGYDLDALGSSVIACLKALQAGNR
jgi:acetoin utilization deacetylase AcuC-like enzyme